MAGRVYTDEGKLFKNGRPSCCMFVCNFRTTKCNLAVDVRDSLPPSALAASGSSVVRAQVVSLGAGELEDGNVEI